MDDWTQLGLRASCRKLIDPTAVSGARTDDFGDYCGVGRLQGPLAIGGGGQSSTMQYNEIAEIARVDRDDGCWSDSGGGPHRPEDAFRCDGGLGTCGRLASPEIIAVCRRAHGDPFGRRSVPHD